MQADSFYAFNVFNIKNFILLKLEWNPKTVVKLIELFKAEQCLYNTKNPLYHNKHARSEALEGIVTKMCQTIPGVTIMDIKVIYQYLCMYMC